MHAPAHDTPPIEMLPHWLPAAVRSYMLAAEKMLRPVLPKDLTIMYRLASDDRMKYVWRELRQRAKSDKALVEFFDYAWQRARLPWFVETPKDRAARAAPYSIAAELCRWTKKHDITAEMNPELAAAASAMAIHFDEMARKESRLGSPLIVKQHSHDDVARAYVRIIGHVVRKLFRSPLYGTVASIASVALDREISLQQVRDWTKS